MSRSLAGLLAFLAASALPAAAQVGFNATLRSHYDPETTYAALWGWTSPGGTEMAILGAATGTYIVDVTAPAAPVLLKFVPGVVSNWREMKTWSHYAYVVTEGASGGLQIIDLAASPPALVKTFYGNFDTAHSISIADGYAYLNGARLGGASRGIRILSLADPVNPVEVGAWTTFYAHDCTIRGDRLYAACINNRVVAVVDIANKAAPTTLATWTWSGNFVHNCDLTADGKYMLTTDEVTGGHLHVWDIQDLNDVRLVSEWTANPSAIIHNVHIRDDLAYIAYYTEGTRVVDISSPEQPVEIAWYDTWPGTSGGFRGNWEVYAYTANGTAYLSDIDTGLYVVSFQRPASASGVVREAGPNTLLAGASVTLAGGAPAISNGSGWFRRFAAPGTQTLVTSRFGFEPDTASVALTPGLDTLHDVALARRPSTPVQGTVRDAVSSLPVLGASILVDGTPLAAGSDAAGAYDLGPVPYGVYSVTASRFGFLPQQRTLTVTLQPVGVPIDLDFDLQPAGLVTDFDAGPAGWAQASPADSATSGRWTWADPIGSGAGTIQPEDDHTPGPGGACWVTANAPSAASLPHVADVDSGHTVLRSPVFDLTGMANPTLRYWRWFSNHGGALPLRDSLQVDISNDGGTSWTSIEDVVSTAQGWVEVTVPVAAVLAPTAQMRVRFIAGDVVSDTYVEAAIDDFAAFDAPAPTASPPPAWAARLHANAPNPFNPSTRLRFDLARPGPALLRVFDVRGRVVRVLDSGWHAAGPHAVDWDGCDDRGRGVASGVYFYRLETPGLTASRRMVLLQ